MGPPTTVGRLGRQFLPILLLGIVFGFGFACFLLNTVVIIPPDQAQQGSSTQTEAERLAKEVKVLCWVMTGPANYESKAIHVKRTWGMRCNKLIFMSSTNDSQLPAIGLKDVKEGRGFLWAKTKAAFKYVYENHFEDADWFIKADDDTFVVVENLRWMLKDYDPKQGIYLGAKFTYPKLEQGYISGGSGYVLSKEALRRFVEEAIPDKEKCRAGHGGGEDVEMAKCLKSVGVEAGDSRDEDGRLRFLPFRLEHHISDSPGNEWGLVYFSKHVYHPLKQGRKMDSYSDTAVGFHRVYPNQMYLIEYLLYHVRPYGIESKPCKVLL